MTIDEYLNQLEEDLKELENPFTHIDLIQEIPLLIKLIRAQREAILFYTCPHCCNFSVTPCKERIACKAYRLTLEDLK